MMSVCVCTFCFSLLAYIYFMCLIVYCIHFEFFVNSRTIEFMCFKGGYGKNCKTFNLQYRIKENKQILINTERVLSGCRQWAHVTITVLPCMY